MDVSRVKECVVDQFFVFNLNQSGSFDFDVLFVPGRMIRYVDIPAHINVAATLAKYVCIHVSQYESLKTA